MSDLAEQAAGPTPRPVVLITGAAQGIGAGMAGVFAGAGYRVAIADLEGLAAEAAAASLGPEHAGFGLDVADETVVRETVFAVERRFGRIDAVVNNAGIGDSHLPTLEQDFAAFRKVLDVHLAGSYLVAREAGRGMIARGAGSIVNVSSIAGLTGMPRRNAYSAAKAGIVAMTEALACEWAARGVRVNAIAPGYVETALVAKLIGAGRIDRDRMVSRVPMGRLGRPEEIGQAALFLCSPRAGFITGSCLSVDGGWAAFNDAGPAWQPER
ncbi:glucose 1-dehydrogenase [Acidimangrovimonas sediminis]|uniref:glucose 1-dehydrogenase n=1 Tax=Acidimangrovimonas sediminis TaxID=2056283 RepID=UPI000C7F91A5|nr:glucose 1-dehydrogenase [Acidimangrovimonas sediminis]